MDWPFILGVFFPILPDRLQTTLLKNMQLNNFPSSNSFMWMTNVCFFIQNRCNTCRLYKYVFNEAPGRSEKTKDLEKSHHCICCIFKPSGCEGEITELKAHKKYWYHSASAHRHRLRPRSRGGLALTEWKRATRAQMFVLVAVIPLWFLLCI